MSSNIIDRFLKSKDENESSSHGERGRISSYKLFDEEFPSSEQLPRTFDVIFCQIDKDGKPRVSVFADGRQVGDQLTDNSYMDDGYRFHDVFHFGFAALLGWSPMTRTLFDCKRRSAPAVDEVEDGGRAKVIEEAICALIYDYARQRNYLAHADHIEPELINGIRSLAWDREVRARSHCDWEFAILRIYEVWRAVWTNAGGRLVADLCRRQLTYIAGTSADPKGGKATT
jgi:hypothetical protein